MDKKADSNIFLIGFSTTGKSKAGEKVAQLLGWESIDLDEEIEKRAGKTILRIFAEEGEEYFRELERQVLLQSCEQKNRVVATGGGAILDPRNRELMTRRGMMVCLEAKVETIYQRMLRDIASSGPLRPLLNVPNALERIHTLKEFRQPYYAIADWIVHTDYLTLEEVALEVVRGWQHWVRCGESGSFDRDSHLACEVRTATEHYPIFVGWGLREESGQLMRQTGLSGVAHIISDATVFSLWGASVERSLKEAGFQVTSITLPPGETTKNIEGAVKVYDLLVKRRGERGDAIVALGGGMIGDLAGFVAATFLRGLPFVQMPTSLIGMVDAAIGGKVAVNHPQGKNLIGAFYQPRLVVVDVQTLTTLPRREVTSGWAEVIKHGLVLDPELVRFLEQQVEKLLRLETEAAIEAIKRSAVLKARIVSEDERETGKRSLLNYGHTIGHGLEAASGYQRFLHGEAVAVGMMGAALLSQRLGLLSQETVERQRALLQRFGLPVSCGGVDREAILKAMELDKKVRKKAVRWVLLRDVGQPVIRDDVPQEDVVAILEELVKV